MSTQLTVENLPKNSLAYTNCVYVSPSIHASLLSSIEAGNPESQKDGQELLIKMGFNVYKAEPNGGVTEGGVAMNGLQRRNGQVSAEL